MPFAARHDYRHQAETYDRTRGASSSILGPLRTVLGGAPGHLLLEVGGGTGNYSASLRAEGWRPVVLDVSAEMLSRAAPKGLPVLLGDATRLPASPRSFDAVTLISVLHLITDWRAALAEARRVLRPGGRLAIMAYTRENLAVHWVWGYFPTGHERLEEEHQSVAEIVAELPGARVIPFEFTDLEDASTAALCRHPHLLLDRDWRAQTSFFERLAQDDPAELAAGLARLERDLAAGRRPDLEVEALRRRYGDGTVIGWSKEQP